ncbi:Methyltransferase [gamma proteobacterium IMCC2047]|nr:Methyltransferase [gamma proteobacterium IMCC2047]
MSRPTKTRTARHKKTNSSQSNTLRIIGGKWRGRKVSFPDSQGLRPTSDRVRETLFNWLAPVIHEARCLDLFSGSGALSLEALSRGAGHATLIDASAKVSEQLRSNLKLLACDNATVLTTNASNWLSNAQNEQPYDLIFLDPPFNQQLVAPSCQLLEDKGIVEEGSYIYIETEASLKLEIPSSWHIHREKKAGQVAYYLCIKEAK